MSKPEFVHLHVHSQYSLLDGVGVFPPLFERVEELGMPAVALTDHGNLFGTLAFFKAAKKSKVKPIIGCEVYLSPTDRTDRTSPEARRIQQHMVLLAKDYQGYLNLAYLVSKGYLEGFYRRPRIDKELLAERKEGLIGLSGCLGGVVASYFRDERDKEAYTAAGEFAEIMGPDSFYIELMDHGLPEQKTVNQKLLELSKKMNLPVVATNDAHYLRPGDAKAQDLLLAIGTGKTLDEEGRFTFEGEEFYLKSPEEMHELFGHVDGALSNTLAIAEQCNVDDCCTTAIVGRQKDLLPEFIPDDGSEADAHLRRLVDEGLEDRYGEVTEDLRKRADFELDVIESMGFVSYFLVVSDFILYAKENKIAVGPGRGSGAGSIVAYALGITDLCPIENKLFFERFLNPERVSMPDFDIDFCPLRREEVIAYVRDKYGEANTANIITFGKMKAKAAVRDVGRVMGVPLPQVDRIAKMIPNELKMTLKKALDEASELRDLYDGDPQIKALLDGAMRVEGAVRQPGMHAAGVVVSNKPLIDVIPLYKQAGKGEAITQFDMNEVEEIGLLKIDFLGLKNLTVIEDCMDMVRDDHGVEIDWDALGLEDDETYKLFQRGEGFGVFQVESSGMRKLLRQARPGCFEDIVALIALYRPGPMDYIPIYIARKHGEQEVTYLHPWMEESLADTYGLIVYQEQVMQVAQRLANFSLGKADILRRAMGKKKEDVMREMRQEFREGCATNEIGEKLADDIFDMIMEFAKYGFNKAHAAAYAVITFRTAYLKAHYPAEFMAALLTNEIRTSASDKLGLYIGVAREMGLKVLPPDINESDIWFSVTGGDVRFGLAGIKNVGRGPVEHILEGREDGPFESFHDFCSRADTGRIGARAIECLITAGAFDSLDCGTRPQLEAIMPMAIEVGQGKRRMAETGQTSLFDMMEPEDQGGNGNGFDDIPLPNVPDWSDREKFNKEKELAGIFLSGHPLDRFRPDIMSFTDATASDLADFDDGVKVCMVGMIMEVKEITTKKGDPMAFVTLEDFEGKYEVLFFPRTFDECRDMLLPDNMLYIEGKFSRRPEDDEGKVLVDRAHRLEDLRRTRTKFVDVEIRAANIEDARLERLRGLFRSNKGKTPVRFRIEGESGEVITVQADGRFKVNLNDGFLKDFDSLSFPVSLRFADS